MNPTQYDLLTNTIQPEPQEARAKLLYNQAARTLMYGHTAENNFFHVYLDDGLIHKVVYTALGRLLEYRNENEGLVFADCVPAGGELYPETCDFELCSLLKRRGVPLAFTKFNTTRAEWTLYGARYEALRAGQAHLDRYPH